MVWLARMRLSTRMQFLVGLTLLGLVTLSAVAIHHIRQAMIEERQQEIEHLVQVGIGILQYHHELVASGAASEPEAKKLAANALRGLRFGHDDYFFGFDTTGTYVVHGGNAKMEGQNKIDLKDVNGRPIIRDLIAAGQAGGGYVDYWFPRAGQQTAEPKLGYAKLFAPWNWVIGTGVYMDDIDREYRQHALMFAGISLGLLVILGLAGYLIGKSVITQLGGEPAAVTLLMQRVADGDLTISAPDAQAGSLMHSLDAMAKSLRQIVGEINTDANTLVANAESIASASEQVAQAAEQQADATSAMAAAIEQLTVSSSHISDSARETSADSRAAVELSSQGEQRVGQARSAIQQVSQTVSAAADRIRALEGRAEQISSIANVIKDIAGQTNLLALNAAIEAARAGEQGRGFAVVADEVRKLAERTSSATTEIEQMIGAIQSDTSGAVEAMSAALPEVDQGVMLAESANESLRAIEDGARRTLARVGEVADATHEQSSASTSIAQRVEQIAHMVEETTATIRGTARAAHELERISISLKTLISRFRT